MEPSTTTSSTGARLGIFVRGIVAFVQANAFIRKKDSKRMLRVVHELVTHDGMVDWEKYYEVEGHPGIEIQDEEVIKFPRYEELITLLLKANHFREQNGRLVIQSEEVIAE